MKRILSLLIAGCMTFALFASCSNSNDKELTPSSTPSGETTEQNDYFYDIQPLSESVTIRYAAILGSPESSIPIMAEKLGLFEKANIDFECIVYANGIEIADDIDNDAWDVSQYGMGGMGEQIVLNSGYFVAPLSRSVGTSNAIFVKNDSSIITAGTGQLTDNPDMYADAESWRGKTIYLPTGSTLHYLLYTALNKMGLSQEDVDLVNKDVDSINTDMKEGSIEIGGLWTPYSQDTESYENYKAVIDMDSLNISADTNHVVTKDAWDTKQTAVLKYYEVIARVIDWLYSSDENMNEGAGYYKEWSEENGNMTSAEECLSNLKTVHIYNAAEWYSKITTQISVNNRNMSEYKASQYSQFLFLIDCGKYSEESEQNFFNREKFIDNVIKDVYSKLNK
ncbi:MAG: ABC transporter substrate-binding protein [Eubacteriales bacterium]